MNTDFLLRVPEGVSAEVAAAMPLQGLTAQYLATSSLEIKPGQTALVHAGAGGVGLLLTQIIKYLGGNVISTVSTEEKAELSSKARADEVFLNGEGVDVAYNGVGKDTFDASPASIRPLAWFGAARRSWRRVRRCSSTVSSTAGSTSASAQHLLWPMLLTKEHIAHDTARFAGEPLRRQRHAQWGLRARSRASMCGRTVSQITVQS
nr:hypothetical protein [Brevibacterium aurantiacum]